MTIRETRTAGVLLAIVALLLTMVSVQPADATIGDEGCTPGYWKNHHDSWPTAPPDPVTYLPTTTLGSTNAFAFLNNADWQANYDPDGVYASFAGDSMDDALRYKGGNGLDGATRILLRAAVAAQLNTVHRDVDFIETNVPRIPRMVNLALRTSDRGTILALATLLDNANNGRDGCPLN